MIEKFLCIVIISITTTHAHFGTFIPGPFMPYFRSHFESPSFRSLSFPHHDGFSPLVNIRKQLDQDLKPLRVAQTHAQMKAGIGGVTLVASPGKVLINKNGQSYECSGQVVFQPPFCNGRTQKFQIKTKQDFCYSDRHSQMGNVLCIANTDQTGLSMSNNNGHFSCSGSDGRQPLLITTEDYRQMCGKMPWDTIYYYYPDSSDWYRVQLPNPDLKCAQSRSDVCVFKTDPNSPF
ncbi:hypothetical protein MTP99_000762 [Tenebrio molitor]|nr:hypothetical protein MTP99_000762 [Tenebrio molitor]CAH1364377.1 unnamed protein product [Tenebrio molitor]